MVLGLRFELPSNGCGLEVLARSEPATPFARKWGVPWHLTRTNPSSLRVRPSVFPGSCPLSSPDIRWNPSAPEADAPGRDGRFAALADQLACLAGIVVGVVPIGHFNAPPPAASCHLCVLGHANGVTVLGGRMLEKSSNSALAKSIYPPALQHWHQQLRQTRRTGGRLSVAAADGAIALEETSEAAIPIEKRYPAFPAVLDINAIRNILPHRFPFLLVDRVIEYNPGVSAVAIKNVTINDNFFPGHFPDRPIMPGVLMVEALAQVGGIVMLNPEVGGSKENFFFAGVDKVRFRKPVIAGDTLVMRMTLVKLQKRFGIAKMEGKAYVGGEVVCDGEFLMALGSEG